MASESSFFRQAHRLKQTEELLQPDGDGAIEGSIPILPAFASLAPTLVGIEGATGVAANGEFSAEASTTPSAGNIAAVTSSLSPTSNSSADLREIEDPNTAGTGLQIRFFMDGATVLPQIAVNALFAAAQIFESAFTDNITVNIAVGWGEVGGASHFTAITGGTGGEEGQVASQFVPVTYATLMNYLANDARSADDVTAVNNLLNTSDPTHGGTIQVPLAEARALGLYSASDNALDAWIGFNTSPNGWQWSYDPNENPSQGFVDFIGVAAHEISHALGRVAGLGRPFTFDFPIFGYTPLDLFRFSSPGVRDLSGSAQDYFSFNNGFKLTNNPLPVDQNGRPIYQFQTRGGDPADWTNTDSFGFYDQGIPLRVSPTDLREMDVLGYSGVPSDDTVSEQVPASITATAGMSTAISGIQVIDDGLNGETFAVSVFDNTGILSATGASNSGTTNLSITGTLSQVNAALSTLTYRNSTAGSDSITVTTSDLIDGSSASKNIGVAINAADDTVGEQVPASITATAGMSTAISGIQVIDDGLNGETFAVSVFDNTGILSATGASNSGTTSLSITGTLSQVNAALSTLTYRNSTAGGDTITVTTSDLIDHSSASKTIGVTINATDNTANEQVPASITATAGVSTAISGVRVLDDGLNGETFAVSVFDNTGILSATGAFNSGTTSLSITGTLSQVNAALSTLTYRNSSAGGDTITVTTSDLIDHSSASKTIGVTIKSPNARNDFNGDGKSDLLLQLNSAGNSLNGNVMIDLMNGTTITSSAATNFTSGIAGWSAIGTGDFNADGKADILWQNADGTPAIWLMNGTSFTSVGFLPNPGSSWHVIGAGDFNHDGKSDILLQNNNGNVMIDLMNGTTVTSSIATSFTTELANWHAVGAGDFLGNGQADILWQNSDGTPAIWLMNGTGIASVGFLANPGTDWRLVGTGDFNGDGMSDLLFQSNSTNNVMIDLMNGTTVASSIATSISAGLANWRVIGTSDVNGDGKADILWQNSDGTPAIWLMNGTGITSVGFLPNPGATWHLEDDGPFSTDQAGGASVNNTAVQPNGSLYQSTPDTVGGNMHLSSPDVASGSAPFTGGAQPLLPSSAVSSTNFGANPSSALFDPTLNNQHPLVGSV
jgi:FG-GAP-like repeat